MADYTPPVAPVPDLELVHQWWREAQLQPSPDLVFWLQYVASKAAAWGYHQAQVEFDEAAMGILPPPELADELDAAEVSP